MAGDNAVLVTRTTSSGEVSLGGSIYYAPTNGRPERELTVIECGPDCTLLIETDATAEGRDVDGVLVPESEPDVLYDGPEMTERELKDGPDAMLNIMFYYTQEYRDTIAPTSPQAYVDIMVAQINEGYIKSGLNLRVRSFCVRQSVVPEIPDDSSQFLRNFRDSKRS